MQAGQAHLLRATSTLALIYSLPSFPPHPPTHCSVLHVPSMTVFSNWPTSKSPLHYVHSAAYSPHSGYLAIGNARGRVLLYRLHHYSKA